MDQQTLAHVLTLAPHQRRLRFAAEDIKCAVEAVERAKSGHEAPSLYLNGCKSRAQLVRKRERELQEIQNRVESGSYVSVDLWSLIVDAAGSGLRIPGDRITEFSTDPIGSAAPLRTQLLEMLASKGYQIDPESGDAVREL